MESGRNVAAPLDLSGIPRYGPVILTFSSRCVVYRESSVALCCAKSRTSLKRALIRGVGCGDTPRLPMVLRHGHRPRPYAKRTDAAGPGPAGCRNAQITCPTVGMVRAHRRVERISHRWPRERRREPVYPPLFIPATLGRPAKLVPTTANRGAGSPFGGPAWPRSVCLIFATARAARNRSRGCR